MVVPLFVLAVPLGITELFWTTGTFLYNVVFQQARRRRPRRGPDRRHARGRLHRRQHRADERHHGARRPVGRPRRRPRGDGVGAPGEEGGPAHRRGLRRPVRVQRPRAGAALGNAGPGVRRDGRRSASLVNARSRSSRSATWCSAPGCCPVATTCGRHHGRRRRRLRRRAAPRCAARPAHPPGRGGGLPRPGGRGGAPSWRSSAWRVRRLDWHRLAGARPAGARTSMGSPPRGASAPAGRPREQLSVPA